MPPSLRKWYAAWPAGLARTALSACATGAVLFPLAANGQTFAPLRGSGAAGDRPPTDMNATGEANGSGSPPAIDDTAGNGDTPAEGAASSSSVEDGIPDPLRGAVTPRGGGAGSASATTELGRINLPQAATGRRRRLAPADPSAVPGIRVGTFVLRPELEQAIGSESERFAGTRTDRTFSETTARGTLTSDWSRHQLTVKGQGTWQENISGEGETDPSADVDADLRLDLSHETIAHLTAAYRFFREDPTDPNSIIGADSQADVNVLSGGASLERSLGRLRGSVTVGAERTRYGDVTLADGSQLSQSDRDTTSGDVALRVGYEISPAIIPFVEARYRRTRYDAGTDSAGFARSSDRYTGAAGVAVDFGEKLSGELAAGYTLKRFDDDRLDDLDGLSLEGTGRWSPVRGTEIALGLATALEESTTPGESGPITYALNGTLTQQVRRDLVARLGAEVLLRNYVDGQAIPDETVYTATGGLTWSLNRYLALTGDASFQRTRPDGGDDQDTATLRVGLTVRR